VLVGSAGEVHEVADLVRTKAFQDLISKTTSADADRNVGTLEKWLGNEEGEIVLYSLKEVEDLVYGGWANGKVKPEHLMLTNRYMSNVKVRNRVNRLLQIANNNNVKTVIVDADTPAGNRLTQLGGLVCLARFTQTGVGAKSH
jgi:stalled ribosome rescue protein Dom34